MPQARLQLPKRVWRLQLPLKRWLRQQPPVPPVPQPQRLELQLKQQQNQALRQRLRRALKELLKREPTMLFRRSSMRYQRLLRLRRRSLKKLLSQWKALRLLPMMQATPQIVWIKVMPELKRILTLQLLLPNKRCQLQRQLQMPLLKAL